MFQGRVKILSQKKVSSNTYHIVFNFPEVSAGPGQFISVLCDEGNLLRRPFSIHWQDTDKMELLYRVRGTGTQKLRAKKKGDSLDVMGPLGQGYRISDKNKAFILVAGGMGVASLLFLAKYLKTLKRASGVITVLIGARMKDEIFCVDRFRQLGCKVKVATEDGSLGQKGMVTDLLNKLLASSISHPASVVYACGPRPMLKEVSRISRKFNISCQVSIEEHIACGVGACRGCAIRVKGSKLEVQSVTPLNTYKLVCKDGPVFNAGEILW